MMANASESDRSSSPDTRVAVLSSNVGGHVQVLLEHSVVGQWIALVVAEQPDAYALRHAQWHGVTAVALHAGKSYLDLYDTALVRLLEEHSIDYVVVAGFLRDRRNRDGSGLRGQDREGASFSASGVPWARPRC
jgi:hypothetical protein